MEPVKTNPCYCRENCGGLTCALRELGVLLTYSVRDCMMAEEGTRAMDATMNPKVVDSVTITPKPNLRIVQMDKRFLTNFSTVIKAPGGRKTSPVDKMTNDLQSLTITKRKCHHSFGSPYAVPVRKRVESTTSSSSEAITLPEFPSPPLRLSRSVPSSPCKERDGNDNDDSAFETSLSGSSLGASKDSGLPVLPLGPGDISELTDKLKDITV